MEKYYSPSVCIHKTDVMQEMQHYVSHGYYYWTTGAVHVMRALSLAHKFDHHYQVSSDRNRRARTRAIGQATSVFILYPSSDSAMFSWWLLASEGAGNVHVMEVLKDTRLPGERLCWGADYELAKATKAGRGKPFWSWRMTGTCWAGWQERIRRAGRSQNDAHMRQVIYSLYRVPGFATNRSQVGKLVALAKKEWRHAHRVASFPPTPKTLGYVRFRSHETQPLSDLVDRYKKGRVGWFGAQKRGVNIERE